MARRKNKSAFAYRNTLHSESEAIAFLKQQLASERSVYDAIIRESAPDFVERRIDMCDRMIETLEDQIEVYQKQKQGLIDGGTDKRELLNACLKRQKDIKFRIHAIKHGEKIMKVWLAFTKECRRLGIEVTDPQSTMQRFKEWNKT